MFDERKAFELLRTTKLELLGLIFFGVDVDGTGPSLRDCHGILGGQLIAILGRLVLVNDDAVDSLCLAPKGHAEWSHCESAMRDNVCGRIDDAVQETRDKWDEPR